MKNTVHFGFIAIILIMTALAFVWLGQVKNANETVLHMMDEMDTKIEYAHIMHDTIRDRHSLLLSMMIIDDPFEIDEKITLFHKVAYNYRKARIAIHALPMDDEERAIHQLLDDQANRSRPVNNKVVEMFSEAKPKKEIVTVLHSAQALQDDLLQTLEEFVKLQRSKDQIAFNYSRKVFENLEFWISVLGLVVFIISVLISRYVGKAVAEKNQQLIEAGEDMAKAYVKAEAATELKSEFLATMSHEIRTPLTAIIGFAETTLFSEQTMEQRLSAINTIIRSGRHLLQLVNDILDMSKVEANKLEIEQSVVSPFSLLAEVERMERPAAESKGLGFSFNYIFPLPSEVSLDPFRVRQILLNLCSNAIKFTDQGHVLINVSSDENNHFHFEVVDSGIGITEEQQNFIFQAYRQADSSITRKFGGTGLGLSLSKILAERMGGSITVKSDIGKGSVFTFELPYEKTSNTQNVYDMAHAPDFMKKELIKKSTTVYSGKVLLAEDNIDNQELVSILLRRMGVEVSVAENGKVAVAAVAKNHFDLILMDMRMPVMGGLEAVKLIRQQGYKTPVIAVTANAMLEDKEACFSAGCNDFLTKPIDAVILQRTLSKYLEANTSENKSSTAVVSSLLEHDPEMITLVKRFVSGLPEVIKEIEKLIDNTDWSELSEALHKLKGTAANFGFNDLSTLAGKMEFQVANKNINELTRLFISLNENYQKILLGLKSD